MNDLDNLDNVTLGYFTSFSKDNKQFHEFFETREEAEKYLRNNNISSLRVAPLIHHYFINSPNKKFIKFIKKRLKEKSLKKINKILAFNDFQLIVYLSNIKNNIKK